MKVIDLLNKIANGEKVPIKIKVDNKIYIYDVIEHFYKMRDKGDDLLELCTIFSSDVFMNMEVEIMKIDEFPQYENAKDINIQDIEELEVIATLKPVSEHISRKENLRRIHEIEVNNFDKIYENIMQQNKLVQAIKHLEKTKEDK